MVFDGALDAVGLADRHGGVGGGLPDDAVALLVVEDEHGRGAVSRVVGVDVLDGEGQDNPLTLGSHVIADGASLGGLGSLQFGLSLLDRIDPHLRRISDQTFVAERLREDGNPAVVLELGQVVLLHPEVHDRLLNTHDTGMLQPNGALFLGSVVSGPFLGISEAAEGAGQVIRIVGTALAHVLISLLLGDEALGGGDPSDGGDEGSGVIIALAAPTVHAPVIAVQDGVNVVGGAEDLRNVHTEVEIDTGVTDLLLGTSGLPVGMIYSRETGALSVLCLKMSVSAGSCWRLILDFFFQKLNFPQIVRGMNGMGIIKNIM